VPSEPSVRTVTGDAVEVDVRVARIGSRTFARLVDLIVQIVLGLVFVLVAFIVVTFTGSLDGATVGVIVVVSVVVTFITYPVVMETFTGGRTVGKIVMGLRVVRDDGGPIRFRHALTRTMVGFAAEFPGLMPPLTWFTSVITMMSNADAKRLGDIAAGTIVIHDRTAQTWGWVPAMPPHLEPWAAVLDLTGLSDDLALAVRNYLSRNRGLREPARTRLGVELTAEVAACVSPPPPGGTPGWAYLAAVLAERHRRAARRILRSRAATAAVWPELARLTTPPHPPNLVVLPPPPHPPFATPTQATGPVTVRAATPPPEQAAAGRY
jgi:uncharacterized RDD family membrane protein YckC